MCKMKDDPDRRQYGDCVRACVASILELDAEDVPHWYHDDDGNRAASEMREWLSFTHGMVPAYFPLPQEMNLHAVGEYMTRRFADVDYMLWCNCGGSDHSIVCRNDIVTHNPAWYKSPIDGAHSSGVWIIIILAKLP